MQQKRYRRRIRLIQPRLQLRLMASFFGISVLALALQYLVFVKILAELALQLPNDGAALMTELSGATGMVFMFSVCLLLPATFAVGLLVTHHIAGPIYRFEMYLKQVIAGETHDPCRIRKGDELQELCDLINRATEAARGVKSEATPSSGDERRAA